MAKHRTAFQLLQDAQKKIAQLTARVARETVSEHKDIIAFDARAKSVQQELTKVRRWTNDEHGLTARIEKLTAQIAEAESNLANATQSQNDLETELKQIKTDRQDRAVELIATKELDIDFEALEAENE